jgi:NAD(P)H-nitrite reductase large subunit
VGIRPNVELARQAGIPVGKGVLVDSRMRTRVPDVYAAGDIAEHDGNVFGLWPIASEQGQTAAVNALGGDLTVTSQTPATLLKGVDLELFSIGRVTAENDDEVIVCEPGGPASYRCVLLSGGRIVGATVLGHHPNDVTILQKAVRSGAEVDARQAAALRRGECSVLAADQGTLALAAQ